MDDVDLTVKLCRLLGTLDGWEWRDTGPAYDLDVIGVYYGATKGAGRACGVRVYSNLDDRLLLQRRVQLKFVGAPDDPAGADRLADAAAPLIRDLCRWEGISGAGDRSMVPLGIDGNRREQRTDNWLITLDNEEATT